MTDAEYKKIWQEAQKKDPLIFGYGYETAIGDITEKMKERTEAGFIIDAIGVIEILQKLNTEIGETTHNLIK